MKVSQPTDLYDYDWPDTVEELATEDTLSAWQYAQEKVAQGFRCCVYYNSNFILEMGD